jgi:hypothetical protein
MPYVASMATISLTPVGHGADVPEPILRPSPATGHEADILDAEDPCVGYDADTVPSQQAQRARRSTSHVGLLER